MKRQMLVLLVLLLGLYGCAVGFQSINDGELEIRGIKREMSKEEVIKLIGEPKARSTISIDKEEYEVWNYPIQRLWAGKFKPMGSYYYRVLFLNGKVSRWNKVKIFAQSSYELEEPSSSDTQVRTIKIFEKD
ncbi:MAG: DUF2845 domain-containing protein [Candidatus Omnitrophica bacterium]|nr:DUF2845 domain-containing protein [Candidatus Omnitrophota bacterium]